MWGYSGSTEINRLQKLQNRAARIVINNSFDTPSHHLIEKLGWKTINEVMDFESKTIVFKSLNELAPPYSVYLGKIRIVSYIDYAIYQQTSGFQKKVQKAARIALRLGVRNFGTASQLTGSKEPS